MLLMANDVFVCVCVSLSLSLSLSQVTLTVHVWTSALQCLSLSERGARISMGPGSEQEERLLHF